MKLGESNSQNSFSLFEERFTYSMHAIHDLTFWAKNNWIREVCLVDLFGMLRDILGNWRGTQTNTFLSTLGSHSTELEQLQNLLRV